jgi:uncharacterized membrane protein YhaH (DUF805 family)
LVASALDDPLADILGNLARQISSGRPTRRPYVVSMLAAGCLSLVVLPIFGLVAGGYIAGATGAGWGAVVGLVLAVVTCVVPVLALAKAGRRRG